MRVKWVEDASIRMRAGHGLDFHWRPHQPDKGAPHLKPDTLIAVVRGFGWLKDREAAEVRVLPIEVHVHPADANHGPEEIAEAKLAIEAFLNNPVFEGQWKWVSPDVVYWLNG